MTQETATKLLTKQDCEFYLKGGLCSNKEAPRPNHSRCCGIGVCEEFIKREEWGHPQGEPCPYCSAPKYRHEVRNALSRWLPDTYICPKCGDFEAFMDMYREGKDFAFTGLSAQVSIVVEGKAGHIPLAGERGRVISYKEACLIAEGFNFRMSVDKAKEMALVGQSMRLQHQGF